MLKSILIIALSATSYAFCVISLRQIHPIPREKVYKPALVQYSPMPILFNSLGCSWCWYTLLACICASLVCRVARGRITGRHDRYGRVITRSGGACVPKNSKPAIRARGLVNSPPMMAFSSEEK